MYVCMYVWSLWLNETLTPRPLPCHTSHTHTYLHTYQARSNLGPEEYWSKIEKVWEERQALLQRAYDSMLKPAEMLAELISVISKPKNATNEGKYVGRYVGR